MQVFARVLTTITIGQRRLCAASVAAVQRQSSSILAPWVCRLQWMSKLETQTYSWDLSLRIESCMCLLQYKICLFSLKMYSKILVGRGIDMPNHILKPWNKGANVFHRSFLARWLRRAAMTNCNDSDLFSQLAAYRDRPSVIGRSQNAIAQGNPRMPGIPMAQNKSLPHWFSTITENLVDFVKLKSCAIICEFVRRFFSRLRRTKPFSPKH